ncbi:hypothetical protein, partial [Duncaniella sp.]|uniref:hypothetical protein n=1 Tax=Duncaniella sp. TaxID=2518496 RepID=UPI0023C1FB82
RSALRALAYPGVSKTQSLRDMFECLFPPYTAAHSAQVSRVSDPHGMWCPVEDTDLPLRMACFSLSHFFRRGRAAAVENEEKKGVFLDNFN